MMKLTLIATRVALITLALGLAGMNAQAAANIDFANGQHDAQDIVQSNDLANAWQALVDSESSNIKVEYWTTSIDDEACRNAGYEPGCARVCQQRDHRAAQTRCRYRKARESLVAPERSMAVHGYLCTDDRCVAVTAERRTNRSTPILRLDDLACAGSGKAVLQDSGLALSQSVPPAVIPPPIWEWLTGSPYCCQDCWDMHRSLGLPCWMDVACCMGTCGREPGCGGGGGGGTTGGNIPGTGGPGNGSSCGASFEVHAATVEYNGQTCYFDGTVNPTWVNGICMQIAGAGVIYGCEGDVSINEPDEPEETEAPEGF